MSVKYRKRTGVIVISGQCMKGGKIVRFKHKLYLLKRYDNNEFYLILPLLPAYMKRHFIPQCKSCKT
jgi:hypothetical protein